MQRDGRFPIMNRRQILHLTGLSVGSLVANARTSATSQPGTPTPPIARLGTIPIADFVLNGGPMEVELGSRRVATWGYNGLLPGPEIRVTEGVTLQVTINNGLPAPTTIHWHGQPVPNAMDGVPNVTQPPIEEGQSFIYTFVPPATGTYLYHSHVGIQLDRALSGPLIVEPAREELSFDRELVLMLDDWLDGVSGTPEQTFADLQANGSQMAGMGEMASAATPAADMQPPEYPPDIVYPLYLINGRPPEAPEEFIVRRGDKVRLRLINAASATIFRVALAGHRLTVTHADGQPVESVEVDAVRIGQGERYDVLVDADAPGIWQFAAQAEGTGIAARALVRYEGSTEAPPPENALPAELGGKLLSYDQLKARAPVSDLQGEPDQTVPMILTGDEDQYVWMINNQTFPRADPVSIARGGHIRFQIANKTGMSHPMHLHGHFFQVDTGTGQGPLKDTVLVDPSQEAVIDWRATNPGDWAFHCHHLYHQEAGMMQVVRVT